MGAIARLCSRHFEAKRLELRYPKPLLSARDYRPYGICIGPERDQEIVAPGGEIERFRGCFYGLHLGEI